jgi:hypothetical protein
VDWVRTERLLALHRLGPLAASLHRATGESLLPDDVARRVQIGYRSVALRNVLLLETATRLHGELARAGIPSLRFKGAALVASGVYPDPGARPMDDVDLLVPVARAREAVGVLLKLGFRPWMEWTESLPDWLDSITFQAPDPPGGVPLTVDLHWRTEYGDLRYGDDGGESPLWSGADAEEGVPTHFAHLVILAEHVLKHIGYRTHFVGLADVGRVIPRVESWERFQRLASARRNGPGIGLLLKIMAEEAGAPVPMGVVRTLGAERRWLASAARRLRPSDLLGTRRPVDSRAAGALLRGRLAGSPGRTLGSAVRTLWPTGRWLRARYRAPGGALVVLRARYLASVVGWAVGLTSSPVSPNQPQDLAVGAASRSES